MDALTAGVLKQKIRMASIAKPMFSQKSFFGDPMAVFWCFLEALEIVCLIFGALETGLKIECFSQVIGGSCMQPENKDMAGSVVKMSLWARCNNLSTCSWA